MEGAVEIIARFSNADHPVSIEEMGCSLIESGRECLPDPRKCTFLVFKRENQGVCAWAVLLDASADPPVFLDFDSRFNSPVKCSDSFSQYLYSCVWDYSQGLAFVVDSSAKQPLVKCVFGVSIPEFRPRMRYLRTAR